MFQADAFDSLIPTITGKFVNLDDVLYLIVTIQIRNVGSSKIDLDHEGSALILFEYVATDQGKIHTVVDNRLTSFDVLNPKDRYIEPNEVIELQKFISIPRSFKLAYRLDVEIFSKSGFTWNASAIVDRTVLIDNKPELIGL